jgi:hypothetical protein
MKIEKGWYYMPEQNKHILVTSVNSKFVFVRWNKDRVPHPRASFERQMLNGCIKFVGKA